MKDQGQLEMFSPDVMSEQDWMDAFEEFLAVVKIETKETDHE